MSYPEAPVIMTSKGMRTPTAVLISGTNDEVHEKHEALQAITLPVEAELKLVLAKFAVANDYIDRYQKAIARKDEAIRTAIAAIAKMPATKGFDLNILTSAL